MNEASYADRLKSWGVMTANMVPRLSEMPAIQQAHQELSDLIPELLDLLEAIEAERGSLLIKSKRLREAFVQGKNARNRCVDYLRSHYGADNPVLASFGIRPRLPQKRSSKKSLKKQNDGGSQESAAA